MRLSFGLEQRQVQKQILAPRMIQSMEILQLPIQALEARIDQELGENPLLEKQEQDPALPEESTETPDNSRATSDSSEASDKSPDEKELVVESEGNHADDFERLLELDSQVPEYFDERPRTSTDRMQAMQDLRHDAMANLATRPLRLQDALELQLHELDLDDELLEMAERIVSSLDSNGYLTASLPDLLPPDADPQRLALAEAALGIVQQLDPPGVGARDLRECLLLQLTPDMPNYDNLRTLISNHLNDLKENRLPQIQKAMRLSIEQIQETWQELRKLDPKPGARFEETNSPTVTPDVFLTEDENGAYQVYLEDARLPKLRISEYYRRRLQSGDATPEEREYIKRKINSAQWLIESIEQRRSTLTKVAQAIVDHQKRFLDEGPEAIEPLKMQQIADKVKVHVTTVSRAVDDKYIQTPRGIIPLRRFFVGGTTSSDGEEIAWDAIRMKLQELVDAEDKSAPLSDEQLVDELRKHGLTVARRTVTKYRKKMDIPSSRQRKDWSQQPGDNGAPSS